MQQLVAETMADGALAWLAMVAGRYIDGVVIHDADGLPGIQGDLSIPSVTYMDMSVGYTWREQLQIQLGADNVTDKQPPLLYQNNVINANTDVSTSDPVGWFYRLSLTYTF